MDLNLHIEFKDPLLPEDVIPQEVQAALTEALQLLEREIAKGKEPGKWGGTPIGATGALSGSIAAEPVQHISGGWKGIVGTPMGYGEPVEYGTKPHWPPIGPLIPWVIRRFHIEQKDAPGVAFLVARKINRSGTEGAHMFEYALADNRGRIEDIFERAGYQIAARLEQGEA